MTVIKAKKCPKCLGSGRNNQATAVAGARGRRDRHSQLKTVKS